MAQLSKASDSKRVGPGFETRTDSGVFSLRFRLDVLFISRRSVLVCYASCSGWSPSNVNSRSVDAVGGPGSLQALCVDGKGTGPSGKEFLIYQADPQHRAVGAGGRGVYAI